MRKYTARLLTCLVLFVFASMPEKAKASHAAGGEIIYEWISDSTYRFFFKFYRDCTGISEPTTQTMCAYNPCTQNQFNVTLTKYTGQIPPGVNNGSPVSAGCSQYPGKCTDANSPLPGYREWWYTAVVTLNGQCDAWRFGVSISARNTQNNITAGNLYIETTFNNLDAQGNSSPYFYNKPIPYCCLNQPYSYNNGAVDPNGDSLTTDVINPLAGTSCSAPLVPNGLITTPGYPAITFPTNPLQCSNTFNINPLTGQLSFIPSQAGPSTLTVRTKEWRNGILIGSIMRDVQVQVLPSCSNGTPSFAPPGTGNISGGTWIGNTVHGCVKEQLSFTYDLKSTDTAAILLADDNHSIAIPGSSTSYANLKTDSVRGTFTWTPAANQTGAFNLTVTLIDSTCRPPGILLTQTYTIPMFIWPAPIATADTSVCPGDPVQLGVVNGGNYVWSYASGPTNSLSCTNCQFPVASPFAPTAYVVTSQQTAFCNNNKDTVMIDMRPSPTWVKLTDVETCPGNPNQMNLNITPDPNITYTAKWTPGTYLNNPNIVDPIVTPANDITYTVVISASNNACKGFDTVLVDVLDGFKILNNDTAICDGQKVDVNITGDTRYTYVWTTNDPTNGGSISNQFITNPTITPVAVGKYTYTLTASHNNCPNDSIASFDIELQPNPTVTLPDDVSLCYGATFQLGAVVTPAFNYTYDWTPGNTLNNTKIIDPIFFAQSSTKLTMTATTSAGCEGEDEINMTVFPGDFVFLSADTAICPGDTAYLSMTGTNLKSFFWSPEFNITDIKGLAPAAWPTSSQVYTVYGRDSFGCFDTASVRVTVRPRAVIELPDTVYIYPGQSYQMDPKGNAMHYNWFPHVGLNFANISNPVAKPEVNTRYIVTAYTEAGCGTTDYIDVLVSADSYIEMPNAFIPAQSPLKVIQLGEARLKSFTVFNRWGIKVFETSDINQGWDGTYNGEPQPMGVYVYTIEAESYTGRKVTKQGNVTLIK